MVQTESVLQDKGHLHYILVEGCHGMLFMTNCLLLVRKNLSKLFGFVYLCLGPVPLGFAVSAVVCNGLF